ncbi:MAG TPA: acetyl-CoA carboxylase carboxyltransferase subunit alpha [Alphaproteobacteria bacterium]|nr:acetyl-CoA carboxylase carboxyltransferase subunit alpha [Alphaproteobacteria bacterium]
MTQGLDFEKPIIELEGKLNELKGLSTGDVNITEEIQKLEAKLSRLVKQTYAKLTPAQKVQVARHPARPHTSDYVAQLFTEFTPLCGDRVFAEDQAIMGGLARFRGRSCIVLGHERGHDTDTRIKHNFGMARPEGYRKAERLMELGDRFGLPVITFVDTMGAFPGIDAEERGQSEAIAHCLETCLKVEVPVVSLVIGEGGSGGAVAVAAADRVMMMEHAFYSVISPEGCAAILWRSGEHAADAANALKLTAQDLRELGVIDEIVPEPLGGAHRHRSEAISSAGDAIERALDAMRGMDGATLKHRRREKFLSIGRETGLN